MKRLVLAVVVFCLAFTLGMVRPAFAAGDTDLGSKIFAANCAVCHIGGGNNLNPQKTLQKEALVANKIDSVEAIINQVTKGKGVMPAFSGRLSAADIENVATYVLSTAEKGWKK